LSEGTFYFDILRTFNIDSNTMAWHIKGEHSIVLREVSDKPGPMILVPGITMDEYDGLAFASPLQICHGLALDLNNSRIEIRFGPLG